ncbi:MAG: bifunctional UDP-3-O-[3-hydroxymyristoyl] N-acetylglucosamine deacetylase/3-hydroxyacyl-ACP dehydratase [Candidatus Omnitrophica bacterium]|nr:bifunctional UDP-3-O-[3-hydroxymyristoyl] N-acetylglucosamine deacetylase/3-hydroxyacyl-ACP dehydratase [Candidatus Omnitrophota bacterium]
MIQQKTIIKPCGLEGVGLHTGKKVKIELKPAPVDAGIVFIRTDLPGRPQIPAHVTNIIDVSRRPRRTSVGAAGVEIHTVEHLMAALAGLSINNLYIEIDDEEVPGMDGSSLPFVQAIKKAGLQEQAEEVKSFRIKEPIYIAEKDALIIVLPADEFRLSYTLSYDNSVLESQYTSIALNGGDCFEKLIAPSRTFCLAHEVESLKAQGLGKGANYDNTLVVGKEGIIKNKLRSDNECTYHKVLDLIGDLYLLGYPLLGHVVAIKSGHPLNVKLVQKIKQQERRTRDAGVKAGAWQEYGSQLDINAIQKILPHRYPLLLVDRILELEEDKRAVGIKNVTVNEEFFNGHFPDHPVMPAVLTVEAMAQVAGVMILKKRENQGKLAYFMSMNNVKFRKPVVPGDQLRLEVEVVKLKEKTGTVHAKALVEDKVVAEADLMFSIVKA